MKGMHLRLFLLSAVIMLLGATYLAFFLSYNPAPDIKIISFPLPAATMEMLHGAWPDDIYPFAALIQIWNFLFLFSVFLFIVFLARIIFEKAQEK
jgi:hypothetical protein